MILRAREDLPDWRKRVRWIDFLTPVLETHNNEIVRGTSFRRNEVNKNNWLEFVNQKMGVEDSTMLMTSRSLNAASLGALAKKIFKFLPGDGVIASRLSLKVPEKKDVEEGRRAQKSQTFTKHSVAGSFSKREFVVVDAVLRSTGDGKLTKGNWRLK